MVKKLLNLKHTYSKLSPPAAPPVGASFRSRSRAALTGLDVLGTVSFRCHLSPMNLCARRALRALHFTTPICFGPIWERKRWGGGFAPRSNRVLMIARKLLVLSLVCVAYDELPFPRHLITMGSLCECVMNFYHPSSIITIITRGSGL